MRLKLRRMKEAWVVREDLVAAFGDARIVRDETGLGRVTVAGGTVEDRERAEAWKRTFLREVDLPVRRRL